MSHDPRRVVAVFLATVDVEDTTERNAILDRECGENAALRKEVLALLQPEKTAAIKPSSEGTAVQGAEVQPPEVKKPDRTVELLEGDEEENELHFLEMSEKPGSLGRLGHYEVHSVVGRGGFGVVLKAFDQKLARTVAVKVLSSRLGITLEARKRFLREARAGAAIRHDNVVQVYAVEADPVPYMVMEFVPGGSLQQKIESEGPFRVEEAVRIGAQVARGLAAAHALGLVHRDIKPANILLESGPDARARITDFGLARASDDARLTQSGWVLGTPMFMAPEQAYGHLVDHRADLFSLGSVLYAMLSGAPPFGGGAPVTVLRSVAQDTPRPLRELVPTVPYRLCEIIDRLHAKNPGDRFQSAQEVADILDKLHAKLQPSEPVSSASQKTGPLSRTPSQRPARWKFIVAIGVLGLLAVGVIQLTGLFSAKQAPSIPSDGQRTDPSSARNPNKAPGSGYVNDLGMEFALVPRGKSWLGGHAGEPGEDEVECATDFYLGVYEVTRGEWEKVMGAGKTPGEFKRTGREKEVVRMISDEELSRFPVNEVSWDTCQIFIRKLNERVKEEGWVYRLPTSLEWEYACRGGPMLKREDSTFDFYIENPTNKLTSKEANFDVAGLHRPREVGSYPPNRLGLHDMHGNVFEYCDDQITQDGEPRRILRGGSWQDRLEFCEAAHCNVGDPWSAYGAGGLRVARVSAAGATVRKREAKKERE
jgi:serine/threonine protein kinase